MIIGITTTYVEEEQKDEIVPVERVTVEYVRRVAAAGAVPVLLPPVEGGADANRRAARELVERLDDLVLAGGGDLNPATYGDEARLAETVNVFDGRDALELELARLAHERDLPMLGICRGMQVMNIVKGGGIYQDIGVQAGTTLKHIQQAPRSYGTHSIFVEDNTLLTDLWENKRTVVNSLHHQSCSTLGEGFIVSARSADGLIEAIEHKDNRFAVGVQWHPEAMKTEEMGLLFSAFLKAAAEYQQARR